MKRSEPSQIAEKLNISEKGVSDAIAYLIYSEKVHYQIYGYVFDLEGNVICEGEHYNRTIEEAKAKLKQQKSIHKMKFGF